jgi:hypothetical protein
MGNSPPSSSIVRDIHGARRPEPDYSVIAAREECSARMATSEFAFVLIIAAIIDKNRSAAS